MGPVLVVMGHEHIKNTRKVLLVQDQHPGRHSERAARTNRSATPLACGARNGVRTIAIPSPRNTSSNRSVNFGPYHESENGRVLGAPQSPRHMPGLLRHHGALGVGVHPARCTRRLPSSMKNST
jgi:hypothetical protein